MPIAVDARAVGALFALTAAGALRPDLSHAQPSAERVQLTVTRDPRSEQCPDLAELRERLRDRLGRDVVDDLAERHAALQFTRSPRGFVARLRVTGPRRRVAIRVLRSSAATCSRLADAASLVLAIAVDPVTSLRPTARAPAPDGELPPPVPAPPVPAPPVPAPPVPAPPAPAPPVPAPPVTHAVSPVARPMPAAGLQLAALAILSGGVAPGAFADVLRPGFSLRVAALWRGFSLPVDVSAEYPGTYDDAPRRASVSALPVQLAVGLCRRFGARVIPYGCGGVAVAAVFASGRGYSPDAADVAFALALGVRAGVEVPFSRRGAFIAELDLRAMPLRTALALRDPAVGLIWTASPVAATLSIGVAWTNR